MGSGHWFRAWVQGIGSGHWFRELGSMHGSGYGFRAWVQDSMVLGMGSELGNMAWVQSLVAYMG
jgi:hypothetical protein